MLLAQQGVAVAFPTLHRFVRRAGLWKPTTSTVRWAETAPDEIAEMDFGHLEALVARHRVRQLPRSHTLRPNDLWIIAVLDRPAERRVVAAQPRAPSEASIGRRPVTDATHEAPSTASATAGLSVLPSLATTCANQSR